MENFFDAIRRVGYTRGPQRIAGGICGGIAAKTGVGVFWIRIGMLLLFLLPFIGIGLYMISWLLLPWQDGSIPLERLISPKR